jgi:membrane protein YdbS with pleckstrin-like domain
MPWPRRSYPFAWERVERWSDMSEPAIIWDAKFDPKVKPYYMWATTIVLTLTIIGIPFALLYLVLGNWFITKHLDNLGCTLTERTLDIRKGILNKTESTIPLEKITDLQMFQGPIMRHFGLHGFKVETAGQSTPGGSLVNIIGIVDAVAFRKAVLDQRDALAGGTSAPPAAASTPAGDEVTQILSEIRDTLARIESKMGDERT